MVGVHILLHRRKKQNNNSEVKAWLQMRKNSQEASGILNSQGQRCISIRGSDNWRCFSRVFKRERLTSGELQQDASGRSSFTVAVATHARTRAHSHTYKPRLVLRVASRKLHIKKLISFRDERGRCSPTLATEPECEARSAL